MSPQDTPALAKPDHTHTKHTATSIDGGTASHANDAGSPASHIQPSMNRHSDGPSKPPLTLASPQPTPSPHVRVLHSNQRGHMTMSTHRALPEPAVTLPNHDVAVDAVIIVHYITASAARVRCTNHSKRPSNTKCCVCCTTMFTKTCTCNPIFSLDLANPTA